MTEELFNLLNPDPTIGSLRQQPNSSGPNTSTNVLSETELTSSNFRRTLNLLNLDPTIGSLRQQPNSSGSDTSANVLSGTELTLSPATLVVCHHQCDHLIPMTLEMESQNKKHSPKLSASKTR